MIKLNFKQRIFQLLFVSFAAIVAVGFSLGAQSNPLQLNSYDSQVHDEIIITDEDGQNAINFGEVWRSKTNKSEFFINVDGQELTVTFSPLKTTTGRNSHELLKGINIKLARNSHFAYYKIIRRVYNNVIQYKILSGSDPSSPYTNLDTPANLDQATYLTTIAHISYTDWITPNWATIPAGDGFNSVLRAMLTGKKLLSNRGLLASRDQITTLDTIELFALIELRFAELDIAEWISYGNQLIDYYSGRTGMGLMFGNAVGADSGGNDYFQIIHQLINGRPNYKAINALDINYENARFNSPTPAGAFTGIDVMDEDDGLEIEKFDLSIIYNLLEPILGLDDDSTDGIYKVGPINIKDRANPKFEIDFIFSESVIVPQPHMYVLLRTLSRQIASIPQDVWAQYFSLRSGDTAESIKEELINGLILMLFDSDAGNEFSYIGTEDSTCDGEDCEIVSLTFKNQFHASEIMSLVSLVYKYLILSVDGTVSTTDDLALITENLFVNRNFATIKRALQKLLSGFFDEFVDQYSDIFDDIINSLFSWGERLFGGDLAKEASKVIGAIKFSDTTIGSMLDFLKIIPSYSLGLYAIFSDEFAGSQSEKLTNLLNTPTESSLISSSSHGLISQFATKFFRWNYDPSATATKVKLRSLFESTLGGNANTATKQHARILYDKLNERFRIPNVILTAGWTLASVATTTKGDHYVIYTKNFTALETITESNLDGTQVLVKLKLMLFGDNTEQVSVYYITGASFVHYVTGDELTSYFEDFTTIKAINQKIRLKLIKQAITVDGWTLDTSSARSEEDFVIYTKNFTDTNSINASNRDGDQIAAKLKLMLSGDIAEQISAYFTINEIYYQTTGSAEYYHRVTSLDSKLFEDFTNVTTINRKIKFKLIERALINSGWFYDNQNHKHRTYTKTIESTMFKVFVGRRPSSNFGQFKIIIPSTLAGVASDLVLDWTNFTTLTNINILVDGWTLDAADSSLIDGDRYVIYTKNFIDTNAITSTNPTGTQVLVKLKLMLSGDDVGKISAHYTTPAGDDYYATGNDEATSYFEDFTSIKAINQKIRLKLIKQAITADGWTPDTSIAHSEEDFVIYTKNFIDTNAITSMNPGGTEVRAELKLMISGDDIGKVSAHYSFLNARHETLGNSNSNHSPANLNRNYFEDFTTTMLINQKIKFKLISQALELDGWVYTNQSKRQRGYTKIILNVTFKILITRPGELNFGQYKIIIPSVSPGEASVVAVRRTEFTTLSAIDDSIFSH